MRRNKINTLNKKNFRALLIPTVSSTKEKNKELLCVEKYYIYSFFISNSLRDGICYIETKGSYSVKLYDIIIAQEGDFRKSENLLFKYYSEIEI